jgi:CheY-like chemotaxis protein
MEKILLIEDDSILQMIISDMLQTLGYAVDVAGTGKQALALMENNPYGFIFLDLGLPDIDGIELATKMREQGHHMPIVACTGRTEGEAAQTCLEAKINGFLTKPVDIATLKSTLDNFNYTNADSKAL